MVQVRLKRHDRSHPRGILRGLSYRLAIPFKELADLATPMAALSCSVEGHMGRGSPAKLRWTHALARGSRDTR